MHEVAKESIEPFGIYSDESGCGHFRSVGTLSGPSEAAAQRAKQRILREAKKKQKQVIPQTLEAAEYVFVLASLDKTAFNTATVLELYRARWQVELAFKRLKSLMQAGHVPKYDPMSAKAWIQAKLLTVLLIERLQEEARFFSPWGFQI